MPGGAAYAPFNSSCVWMRVSGVKLPRPPQFFPGFQSLWPVDSAVAEVDSRSCNMYMDYISWRTSITVQINNFLFCIKWQSVSHSTGGNSPVVELPRGIHTQSDCCSILPNLASFLVTCTSWMCKEMTKLLPCRSLWRLCTLKRSDIACALMQHANSLLGRGAPTSP